MAIDAGPHPLLVPPDEAWFCVHDECYPSLAGCEERAGGNACLQRVTATCVVVAGDGVVVHPQAALACFLASDSCHELEALSTMTDTPPIRVLHPCTEIRAK